MPGKRNQWAIRLAVLWTASIFIACLWPGKELPKADVPFADKWTHFILFGGFAWLWLRAFPKDSRLSWLLSMTIISAAVGVLVELLQYAIPALGRSGDPWDALADAVGGLLGSLLFGLFFKYRLFRKYK